MRPHREHLELEAGVPGQLPRPPDDSTPDGIHPIHDIPAGVACVYEQVELAWEGGTFQALLAAQYEHAEVAEALVAANDLDEGEPRVFVPEGDRVVVPQMCYLKEGAGAVSLQASGVPEAASPVTGSLLVAVLIGLAVFLVLRKLVRS